MNKIKSIISKEKNKFNQTSIKKRSFNNIIDSIKNKIRKESKSSFSQRIHSLMKKSKEKSKSNKKKSCTELNKNIISLKKFIKLKKNRIEQKNNLRNKLILSFENSYIKNSNITKSNAIYYTAFNNSNKNLNTIQMNNPKKIKLKNIQKKHNFLSNLISPMSTRSKNFSIINISPTSHIIHAEKTEKNSKCNFIKKNNNLINLKGTNYKNIKNINNKTILINNNNRIKTKNIRTTTKKEQNKFVVIDGRMIKTINKLSKKKISTLSKKSGI